jgi:hypothetical protein
MSQSHASCGPTMAIMSRSATAIFALIAAILVIEVTAQTTSAPTPPNPAISASSPFHEDGSWNNRRVPIPTRNHSGFERLAVLSTTAWAADVASTEIGLATTRTYELNPIFGSHPSPARLWGTAISLQGFFLYACHQESKEHPQGRFWRIAMRVSVGVHTFGAVNNLLVIR